MTIFGYDKYHDRWDSFRPMFYLDKIQIVQNAAFDIVLPDGTHGFGQPCHYSRFRVNGKDCSKIEHISRFRPWYQNLWFWLDVKIRRFFRAFSV